MQSNPGAPQPFESPSSAGQSDTGVGLFYGQAEPSFSTTTSPQPHFNGSSRGFFATPQDDNSFTSDTSARRVSSRSQRILQDSDAKHSDDEEVENAPSQKTSSPRETHETPQPEEKKDEVQGASIEVNDGASYQHNHQALPHPETQFPDATNQSHESATQSKATSDINGSILRDDASLEQGMPDENELDNDQLESTPSFHDLFKTQRTPTSTSSPNHSVARGLSLSPISSHSTRSASNHSLQLLHGSQYPEAITERSRSSTPSKNNLNSSPLPGGSADSDSVKSLSASDASASKISVNRRVSPLDNIDRLLVNQSPTAHASKAHNRLPLRLGLLSFNEDYDETGQVSVTSKSGTERAGLRTNHTALTDSGVRRHEDRTRKLETENMELKLKLQQYREMNASEQEITRVKWQVERAERRIDELEQALERKNRTIMELSEERDSLASRVRPEHEIEELQSTIADLQAAVSDLELQSVAAEEAERSTAAAIAEMRASMPDLIAPNAAVGDLLSALKQLHAENRRLGDIELLYDSITQHLQESDRGGSNSVESVKILIEEVASLQQALADTTAAMAHNQNKHTREMELLRESQQQQVDALLASEGKLRQQLAKAQSVQANLKERIEELEEVVENQHKIISDTRAESYSVVRRFFSELIDVMGPEFQASVESELENVIETAQTQGTSKLPLLNELLLRYTHQIAEEAVRSYTAPAVDLKVRAMEQEVQSLEHMLALRLDKNGADAILLAQNRDLRRALKLEQEKRKTDWNEFTKTVAAIR